MNGTEAVKIVMNTSSASLSTVSGTVYHTSATSGNELDNAWIQFTDSTNGLFFGVQATSSGRYSIKVAAGTYQVFASKPGYGTLASVTVSGKSKCPELIRSSAAAISGQVTAAGYRKDAAAKVGGPGSDANRHWQLQPASHERYMAHLCYGGRLCRGFSFQL